MAELADALDSGSSESNFMQVQVLFPAPEHDGITVVLFFIKGNGVKNCVADTGSLHSARLFGSESNHKG